jgi:hypothetical protein
MTWTFITGVDVGDLHLAERLVPQDAGVGDQHVDAAKRPWSLDQFATPAVVGHRGAVGDASPPMALISSTTGPPRETPEPSRAAQVVDDDLGAAPGELQRVLLARPRRRR